MRTPTLNMQKLNSGDHCQQMSQSDIKNKQGDVTTLPAEPLTII